VTKTLIQLEHLSKTYPGHSTPAVENLDLSISDGEIVMFIGPSGCGKTTTMKMINRLIEPSSGRIMIAGEDVTSMDPNELRRRIGYVIQQVGLFPHVRVGGNVGAVLRLLKWPADKIARRVDEMLDLVGLDPSVYRDSYPKQLSGGQQQRVGVARALAADPPVMLMDEPFGSVDPITRERLQDEFLRLQKDIRKTIVFVTHDITEALKMGDRIAILGERSRVEQYDTPANVVARPASAFVADFIGANPGLRSLTLLPIDRQHLGPSPAEGEDASLVYEDGRPVGWRLEPGASVSRVEPLRLSSRPVLADALNQIVASRAPAAVVVDDDGRLLGCVDLAAVQRAVGGVELREDQPVEVASGTA
jgi:osmoprotectant transport system ATP-binding protein